MNTKPFHYSLKRLIPLSLLLLGLIIFFSSGLYHYFNFQTLTQHRQSLISFTQQHFWFATGCFIAIYIVYVSISIPGAVILTMSGGFLFGPWLGTIYSVVAATLGACIIFLASRTAFADLLEAKARGWIKRMEHGFQQNAFNYLLFLRLIPIFPYWIINIVPAILNIRLQTFIVATLLGMIPGSAIYALIGNGLGHLLDQQQTPNLYIIFKPAILLPIIALALLSLLPLLYRKYQQKSKKQTHD